MPSKPHEAPDETGAPDADRERDVASEATATPPNRSADRFDADERPKEYGGRKGPDPVRYGDWEKNGRCIDF